MQSVNSEAPLPLPTWQDFDMRSMLIKTFKIIVCIYVCMHVCVYLISSERRFVDNHLKLDFLNLDSRNTEVEIFSQFSKMNINLFLC